MRVTLRSLLTLIALGCVSPMTHAADIYVLTNNEIIVGSTNTNFGRIDTTNGAYTQIATLTGDVWNLAWNPAAGNFFVTEGTGTAATLRTLTPTGTLSASLGTIGKSVYGMAYRTSDSTLYAFDFVTDDTGTINTANGAWTILNINPGATSGAPIGGRYSIMNDTMYFAGNFLTDGIGTMGYSSISTYQQIAANAVYANMVLANDGTTMYGVFGDGNASQQRLYTINVGTGAATAGAFITGTGCWPC